MSQRSYHVYILASQSRRLYIGVTNNLGRRLYEHKNKLVEGFTSKYNIDRLVYFEEGGEALGAIEREKQLKGWLREKKIALIESMNPTWEDLSETWLKADSPLTGASSGRRPALRMTSLGGCVAQQFRTRKSSP